MDIMSRISDGHLTLANQGPSESDSVLGNDIMNLFGCNFRTHKFIQ